MRLHSSNDYFAPDELLVLKYRKTRNAIKMHGHDFAELMCVVSGHGSQRIGEESYDFTCGSMFLIPSGARHMISFSAETEYYDILVRNEVFPLLQSGSRELSLGELGDGVAVSCCTAGAYSRMCELLRLAYQEYHNPGPGSCDLLLSVLRILLIYLVRHRGQPPADASRQGRRAALPQILDYIDSHYTEPLRLYDVAGMYHYSANSFSKMFKKKFGMTFSDYLHRKRVELAKDRLRLSTDTVSDICRAVGYSNSSEFYRIFQRCTGMSPQEYRQQREADRLRDDLRFQKSPPVQHSRGLHGCQSDRRQ